MAAPAPRHRRGAAERYGEGHIGRRANRLGLRERTHRRVRRVAADGRQVHAGLRRTDYGRRRCGHRRRRAHLRPPAVQRLVPDLGHGHHAAHHGHRQRARLAEPIVCGGAAGQAGRWHIPVARTEQRARMRRRRLSSQRLPRLSGHCAGQRRQVPRRMGRQSAAAGKRACNHGYDDRHSRWARQGNVHHRRKPVAERAGLASRRKSLSRLGVPGGAGHLSARDGADCERCATGDFIRRKGRHIHQQRAAGSARPQGGGAGGRKPPRLGNHLRSRAAYERQDGLGRAKAVRFRASV